VIVDGQEGSAPGKSAPATQNANQQSIEGSRFLVGRASLSVSRTSRHDASGRNSRSKGRIAMPSRRRRKFGPLFYTTLVFAIPILVIAVLLRARGRGSGASRSDA